MNKKNKKSKKLDINKSKYNKNLASVKKDGGQICYPHTKEKEKDKDKQRKYNKQRKKYGFDERETWALEYTSLMWLYEHLQMYIDIGGKIVDFESPLPDSLKEEFSKYDLTVNTQLDVIKEILSEIEKYDHNHYACDSDKEEKAYKHGRRALMFYAIILPMMWW